LFKAIGAAYAPFTLAALPIGSFKPEPMMQHVHMGPEDAIRVHEDLKMPRLSVGIHWGTFMMSDEHYLEPPRTLARLWQDRQDQAQPILGHHHNIISQEEPELAANDDTPSTVSLSSSSSTTTNDKPAPPMYPSQFVTTAFGETVVLA
jgi:hypothetical protein